MAQFKTMGTPDPFLHVDLQQGEEISSESGAIVKTSETINLSGKARGGIFSSLVRKSFTGESFFQVKISAETGSGNALLAPAFPGGIEIFDLDSMGLWISDGSFLACEASITLKTKLQKLSGAFFARTGGLFLLHASGKGKLAVSGLGGLHIIHLENEKASIDNGHIVAWEDSLEYRVGLPESKGGGFLKKAVGAATTGEGVVMHFQGTGRVVVSSRNRPGFIDWIAGHLPSKN